LDECVKWRNRTYDLDDSEKTVIPQ
jgi:hypothetical protein